MLSTHRVATTLGAAGAVALVAGAAFAQPPEARTAITIYSSAQPGAIPPELYRPSGPVPGYYGTAAQNVPGYAIVKERRTVEMPRGRGEVRIQGVAALIDPTTVSFASLTDAPGTRVLEQNFQFDLLSIQKMLERYIDRPVNIDGSTVTLLSTAGGGYLVREGDGQVRWQQSIGAVRFPTLAEGLITRPTLVWDVEAAQGGSQDVRIGYETAGVTWWADYNLVLHEGQDANSGSLDVDAWVSILNQSGATYKDATLKLIAGDVHRAPQAQPMYMNGMAPARGMAEGGAAGFEEKAFFEYHLYTLGRPTTLPDNSTKQIELFEAARAVPCERVLVYYGFPDPWGGHAGGPITDRDLGIQSNTKVDSYLRFANAREAGLGIPLPAGRIRVSKLDEADGSLEFIGEDVLDHTPKDEKVLIRMGSAFDLVGERATTDFAVDTRAHWMEETIEIKVRNHKTEAVTVLVKETLFRCLNWSITTKSHDFEKQDARTVHFPVRIEPDKEVVVRYKVRYTW